MPTSSPDAAATAADSQAVSTGHPLDVAVIADTIEAVRLRLYPPRSGTLDEVVDKLRGHVGLLLAEPLGPGDARRCVIVRAAAKLLAGAPSFDAPDILRWQYVSALATTCDALLMRWIAYVQPEGDYAVRCEPDGDGYYVMDRASGCIASRRSPGISRPARRLPVDEATALARRLNDGREIRQARRPQGR